MRDFNTYRFEKLQQVQIMSLLNFMGVPSHRYNGQQKSGKIAMLREACVANPARGEQGLNAIVFGKVDTANVPSDVVNSLELKVVSLLRDFKSDEVGEIAAQRVNELTSSLRDELVKYGKKALQEAADSYRPIVIKDGGKVRKVKGVLPAEFQRMVELASQRIPIMLVGPAGCGKTYLAGRLAEALNLDFSDQSCSEGMSESVFNGLLLPIGNGGKFEHVASPWMTRYEKGGVMLLDEIDAGDSNLFTYMNKAVANESYTVPQRFKKPVIEKHPDFVLIAAANTFGHGADAMYVGRNQLDAATLDRFKVGLIQMDYSREVEQSIGSDELCEWAWNIRAKIQANGLRRIMSTRVIKDLSKMTQAYDWTRKEWEATYFTGWSEAEKRLVLGGV